MTILMNGRFAATNVASHVETFPQSANELEAVANDRIWYVTNSSIGTVS